MSDLNKIKQLILKQSAERLKDLRFDFKKPDESEFRRVISGVTKSFLRKHRDIDLTAQEHEELINEIISYFLGLGPLDKLLNDAEVTEIMVNGPGQIYVERSGRLEPTDITFIDEMHLSYIIDKILYPLGRRVTELEPYIDARINDGSRVNIIKPPVSGIGPVMTIRKFSKRVLTIDDLIGLGTLDTSVADLLKACVISKLNILICGGSSSGKTTLLNVLSSFIPQEERVITIEDIRELLIPRTHVIPLEARLPNIEGKGEITIRELFKNALHMRPDRIIIGEVRSDEVLDMLQAMNVGHEGSMATLHANSAFEALDRLEVLTMIGKSNMTSEVARRQIRSAIDLVVHTTKFSDGSRKLVQISEMTDAEPSLLQDIFIFDENTGLLRQTGKIPNFYPRLKKRANYYCKEFERQ